MKPFFGTILGVFLSVLPLSQGRAAEKPRGLDVNDVAILFALNQNPLRYYPSLTLDGVLSKEVLEKQVVAFSLKHDASPFGVHYDEWRIIGLRYDPCAPNDSSANTGCHQQVRLITQSGLDDTAMHLLYRISGDELKADDHLVAKLRAIQQAANEEGVETVGLPLQVHPALAKEAPTGHGPVGDLIQAFIKYYCSEKNLEEITFTSTVGGSQWNFFHGTFSQGRWTPTPIHNIPNHGLIQSTSDNGAIFPVITHSSIGLGSVMGNRTYDQADWKPLLLRVENPEKSNSKRVDCASCHVSSKVIAHQYMPDFSSSESFVNPPGLTGFAEFALQPNEFSDNLRNFAYRDRDHPTVSTLTANSAAHVADLINRSQNWENPSTADCSAPEVRTCFSTKDKTASDCLKLCKRRD